MGCMQTDRATWAVLMVVFVVVLAVAYGVHILSV